MIQPIYRWGLTLGLALLLAAPAAAIGRGGGGAGGGRAAAAASRAGRGSAPSLGGGGSRMPAGGTRPNFSRPTPNARPAVSLPQSRPNTGLRPSLPMPGSNTNSQRPGVGGPSIGVPSLGTQRPTTRPATRPEVRPGLPTTRPQLPTTRPNVPTTKPQLPIARPDPGDINDFLGIQRPTRPSTRPVTRPDTRPELRPPIATLPGRPGTGTKPRPTPLPGDVGRPNRPGTGSNWPGSVGNRPNRPETLPGWIDDNWKPGRPGQGGNNWVVQPPNWANRPDWGNVTNRWPRPGRPGYDLNNWLDRHPSRDARWRYWGDNVRSHWHHYHHQCDWFGPNWWATHRHSIYGWHYHYGARNYQWYYWWSVPTYSSLNNWFAWNAPQTVWAQPVYYDYGTGGNVYVDQNQVYVSGQSVGDLADYAASAAQLATVAPPESPEVAEAAEWMPLGTFAVATNERETEPSRVLQLAVNKQGIVSGTFYNSQTDVSQSVLGQVDPETQRVALRLSEVGNVVLETGLYNLTQDEAAAMVHFGGERVEYWLLVRLEAPGNAPD